MKHFCKLFFLLFLMSCLTTAGCEQTLVVYEEDATMDGYTMLAGTGIPGLSSPPAILIDMRGNIVRQYSQITGYYSKLLPGGSVISGLGLLENGSGDLDSLIQESWDGTIEWMFLGWDQPLEGEAVRVHHDFQREGNPGGYYAPGQDFKDRGNTLFLAHENKTMPGISPIPLLDDIIYEIDWAGHVVFEWHASDHIDEFGFDEGALQTIAALGGDWLHSNSVSWLGENHWYDDGDLRFHPKNIIFDSRKAGFMAIIDHQTHKLVWRVGPDYSTPNPEATLGPVVGQHQAHMIPKGLPGAGNILLFDNGSDCGYGRPPDGYPKYYRDYSRVIEFDPDTVEIVWEYSPANGDYLPHSHRLSGVQRLPNGNTLITSGIPYTMLEVTPERQIVWHYRYLTLEHGCLYRATRVPPEWVPGNPSGYSPWE